MLEIVCHARDETETAALGARLAPLLPDGSVVGLRGTLGAGKTRLVQAVAAAEGVDPALVVSPTFVLVHEYHGRRPIYHFDAYRLDDEDQFLQLGPEEYFERPGVVLVEWADRVERCLPDERLDIELEITGPASRQFRFRPRGARYERVVEELGRRIGLPAPSGTVGS